MTARLRLVRRVSLFLLAVWLGVLASSFLRRQIERRPATGQVELAEGENGSGEQPVRVHKGFLYTDSVGVEPNFRVAAEQTVEFASGWFELREVEFTLYHGGEVAYGLTAKRARLNRDRREAIATGDVRLSLGGGVAVSAAGFSLSGQERTLESHGPATFAGTGMGGLAGGVRCRLADNSVELHGGVSIAWREDGSDTPSLVLLAPRVVYERGLAQVSFPDGVTVMRGTLRVQAAGAEATLSGAEGALQRIALAEPVEFSGQLPDGAVAEGRCGAAVIELLEEQRVRVSADPASDTGWVAVELREPDLGWRELNGWRLVGEGTRQAWEWLEVQGLACVTDYPTNDDARHLSAEAARVAFTEGSPTSASAQGGVRVEYGGQWAEGGTLAFSLASRAFHLNPTPGQRVSIGTTEVQCVCDRLESTEPAKVAARGNVSGVLRRGGLWGPEDTPVRFAAESAVVTSGGSRLDLDGEARLWQGDRMVRADHIAFERDTQLLTAVGKVVTLARISGEERGAGELAQLRSRSMRYQHDSGLAVYEGDVSLEESASVATCQKLTVSMNDDGRVLLATLEGGVTVREKGTARVIKGQSARVDAGKDTLEIVGTPVIVEQPGGDQVKAARLLWSRPTGTLYVFGEDGNPTETIYHPPMPAPTPGTAATPKRTP